MQNIILQIIIAIIKILNSRLFQLLLLLGGLANFIINRYNLNIDKIHYINMSTGTTPSKNKDTNTKSEGIKINWWNSLKLIIKYTIFTNLIIGAGLMLWALIETAFDYYGLYIFSIKYYFKNILEYYHNIYYSFLSNLASKLNSYSDWIKSLGSSPNVDTLNTVDNKDIINTVNEQEIINKIDLQENSNKVPQIPNNQLEIEQQESLRKTYKNGIINRNSDLILLGLGIIIGISSAYLLYKLINYGFLPGGGGGGSSPTNSTDITLSGPSEAGPSTGPNLTPEVSKQSYDNYFKPSDMTLSSVSKGKLPEVNTGDISLPNDPSTWEGSIQYKDPFNRTKDIISKSPTEYSPFNSKDGAWHKNIDVSKQWEASIGTKSELSPTSSAGSLTPKASPKLSNWKLRDFPNIPR